MREFYPEIDSIVLNDYRVRIINAEDATHAKVCVTIQTMDKRDDAIWGSVGASENIIEASWAALRDSIVYGLLRRKLHLGSYPDQDAVEPAAASS